VTGSRERLASFLGQWWRARASSAPEAVGAAASEERPHLGGATARSLAASLRADPRFHLALPPLSLRFPSAEVARELVEGLDPPPSPAEADLLVSAVLQARSTSRLVRIGTLAGATLTVGAFVLRNLLRRR
jgi:hypothetical protein